ncbi:hypothetical protein ES332_D13G205100v1 [Gossypium tomentosum]|uniref:Uncharacterized protein n=1 Tax=Gossypium tomentosum TaxID=34277 RepID=A0A5D2I141_GOSTO|nr:hypothetical protein ES332_D13G205100v1 [Gossypium tomentosum]
MPEITKIILSTSAEMKAEEVGKITIQCIKSGTMAIAKAGLSPQRCFIRASLEVAFAGLFRFVALLLQWN